MKLSSPPGHPAPEAPLPQRRRDPPQSSESELPSVEALLQRRDYAGAAELLRARRRADPGDYDALAWLAYSLAHAGKHAHAEEAFRQLEEYDSDSRAEHSVHRAVELLQLGRVHDAEELARENALPTALKQRLLFHCAHRLGDEDELERQHQQLSESPEDQLAIASVHFLRGYYREAADIYKSVLEEHQCFSALNVYIALCYHKLELYDLSSRLLDSYLEEFPDSVVASNAKACNTFKLHDGAQAEKELKSLVNSCSGGSPADPAVLNADIIRHNTVVFRNGEGAEQHLPPLLAFPRETRLNLAMYHLRHTNLDSALELTSALEPVITAEYIVKAALHSQIGQRDSSTEHVRIAQELFRTVGESQAEKDTIAGRQCMASFLFLLNSFQDVLVYLDSIKAFLLDDDDFNWNYGIAKASVGQYEEAEKALRQVRSVAYKQEYPYTAWLVRSLIMNGKPESAWDVYLRTDASDDSFALLNLIANDCYSAQQFLLAAKAFDVLGRLAPTEEYARGKRGATIGAFHGVATGNERPEALKELVTMLRSASPAESADMEDVLLAMRNFARRNGIAI
jgi:intraflagellar transport protein 56